MFSVKTPSRASDAALLQAALFHARKNRRERQATQNDTSGPELDTAPEITGTPQPGQTLTVTDGEYTGEGDITTHRMWLVDGVPLGIGTTTYLVKESDIGKMITVKVLAKDDNGVTRAFSNSVEIVPEE